VISGGLVFLAIVAERFFGFHLGRRQWIGLLVTAVGLAVLGLTQAPGARQHASAAALIAVECAVIVLSAALICASIRLERLHLREGILLATAAGALFGTSDIAIKHLVHPAETHVMLRVNPWPLSALIAMVVAFYASARSLQLGPAIAVITFTSGGAGLGRAGARLRAASVCGRRTERASQRAASASERRGLGAGLLGEWLCWEADSEALDEIGHAMGVRLQRESLAEFPELVGAGRGYAANVDEFSKEAFEARSHRQSHRVSLLS
jgi:hypothetical protein